MCTLIATFLMFTIIFPQCHYFAHLNARILMHEMLASTELNT